jgi:hypothetical protein
MRSDTAAMRVVLDGLADQASYAMALADTARDNLSKELETYDTHMAQATKFAGEQKENEAKRCLFLARRSAELIKQLTAKVNELQVDADGYASTYQQKKSELEKRKALLPKVEQQLTLQTMGQAKIADPTVTFEDAAQSFDLAVDAVNLTIRQQKNKTLLTTDPNQAIDKSIVDSLERDELERAYNALLNTEYAKSLDGQEETVLIETDSVAAARKLLAKPAHELIVGDAIRSTIKNSTTGS